MAILDFNKPKRRRRIVPMGPAESAGKVHHRWTPNIGATGAPLNLTPTIYRQGLSGMGASAGEVANAINTVLPVAWGNFSSFWLQNKYGMIVNQGPNGTYTVGPFGSTQGGGGYRMDYTPFLLIGGAVAFMMMMRR